MKGRKGEIDHVGHRQKKRKEIQNLKTKLRSSWKGKGGVQEGGEQNERKKITEKEKEKRKKKAELSNKVKKRKATRKDNE